MNNAYHFNKKLVREFVDNGKCNLVSLKKLEFWRTSTYYYKLGSFPIFKAVSDETDSDNIKCNF